MAVKVAILSVVLLGFVALGVDIGMIYNAKGELQRAVTASAIAGATMLSQTGGEGVGPALQAAIDCAESNPVAADGLTLIENDVQFGTWNPESSSFLESTSNINAVKVIGRRTSDSPDGSVGLFFAAVFGISSTDLVASATALMRPRDMAVVADLSNSFNDDTELRSLRKEGIRINLWDVWSQAFERGAWPGWDADDPKAAGWGWDFFKRAGRGWGVELDPDAYGPNSDSGLVQMAYSFSPAVQEHWDPSDAQHGADYAELEQFLQGGGYDGDFATAGSEINSILGDHLYDTFPRRMRRFKNWAYRTAVATGFADWSSGIPNGKWQNEGLPPGNGDDVIDDDEIIWGRATLGNRPSDEMGTIWMDYTQQYISKSTTYMTDADVGGDPEFRWKIGIKTFLNFILERRNSYYAEDELNEMTPELVGTDHQPMKAVRDAVRSLTTEAMAAAMNDFLSLEVYGTKARHIIDLTSNVTNVADALFNPDTMTGLQAGHWDGYTNMGGGIRLGRLQLTTEPPARPNATKIIILLSDGRPTSWEELSPAEPGNLEFGGDPETALDSQPERLEQARQYAIQQAEWARDNGIQIFSIALGADADTALMEEIANITNGRYFRAEGSIEEYSSDLLEIFEEIAVIRPVKLVQ